MKKTSIPILFIFIELIASFFLLTAIINNTQAEDITSYMDLSAGWSMISLPAFPYDASASLLFSGAVLIYGYNKGLGYVRVKGNEELEVGKGYWILLDQNQNYTINGQIIEGYTHILSYENGWYMIGGCSDFAQVTLCNGDIKVIYEYIKGIGYKRVHESENLQPGKGYWILFNNNISKGTVLMVGSVGDMACITNTFDPNVPGGCGYCHDDPYIPELHSRIEEDKIYCKDCHGNDHEPALLRKHLDDPDKCGYCHGDPPAINTSCNGIKGAHPTGATDCQACHPNVNSGASKHYLNAGPVNVVQSWEGSNSCGVCHTDDPVVPCGNGTSSIHANLGPSSDCAQCHGNHCDMLYGDTQTKCIACHSPNPSICDICGHGGITSHFAFDAMGINQEAIQDCISCHVEPSVGGEANPLEHIDNPKTFVKEGACLGCHSLAKVRHGATNSQGCYYCHPNHCVTEYASNDKCIWCHTTNPPIVDICMTRIGITSHLAFDSSAFNQIQLTNCLGCHVEPLTGGEANPINHIDDPMTYVNPLTCLGCYDDNNPCTTDACDPVSGVSHTPVAADTACADGDVCNGEETCDGSGACVAGTPPMVDDGNPCTIDACDPVSGVSHTPVAAGTACADGDVCNGDETCDGSGACTVGTPLDTSDGDPCTQDLCDPITGVSHPSSPAGTACDDADVCNGSEVCDGDGTCVPGTPPAIDDGDPLTLDTCEPGRGIVHRPVQPLDDTVATRFPDAVEFLYSGADPIQHDVAPGAISERQVAVIEGYVSDPAGNPLPGVHIEILDHSELGWTLTQGDGSYQIAVNGGGRLTVRYQRDDLLEVQRTLLAPWNDYTSAENVVMLVPDANVTHLDMTELADVQVVRGSETTDDDGSRCETVLVLPGTEAMMVMPDGSTLPVADLHVRATEFTVGDTGPNAMPAELPPTTGYTYAVEYTVDEAVAAGAVMVRFDPPAISYLENFLGFPVGTGIPMGTYNRQRAVWEPAENGVVVKIVGDTGGLAEFDVDGDGLAEDQTTLDAMGITDLERAELFNIYGVGDTLWRVLVTHFSTWDKNMGGGPGSGSNQPKRKKPKPGKNENKPCSGESSIVECQNQKLIEQIPIAGTPWVLAHASDRVPGHKIDYQLDISLSDNDLPPNIIGITWIVEVAGKRYEGSIPGDAASLANLTLPFDQWDGRDRFGRKVQGRTPARVRIGYEYPFVPVETDEFGYNGNGIEITLGSSYGRTTVTLWEDWKQQVYFGGWDETRRGLGGWTIEPNHAYDPVGREVLMGDGTRFDASETGRVINAFAGNGSACSNSSPSCGENIPATQAYIGLARGISVQPDGSVVFADSSGSRVRKIDPDGIITTLVSSCWGGKPTGDGGPASEATVCEPYDVATGPDGSVYIAERGRHRVRKIDPNGIITTVAGTGVLGWSGDGGPATLADVGHPVAVDVGPDGSLYIAASGTTAGGTIRRVDTNGIISTFAGAATCGVFYCGDGQPAYGSAIYQPVGVAAAPDGSVYIAQSAYNVIRRVKPDGIIETFAGVGSSGYSGEGLPANSSALTEPTRVAVAPDGRVFISEGHGRRIRVVTPQGLLYTVAGNGIQGQPVLGEPSLATSLNNPGGVAAGPDGTIYVSDGRYLRKVTPPWPGMGMEETAVPSPKGDELFVFAANGRHERTLDALTGATLLTFVYDSQGRLVTVTDGDGNVTTVHRDASGLPTSIEAPFGQTTELTLGSWDAPETITAPDGATWQVTYNASGGEFSGQIATFTTPRNDTTLLTYDAWGRLEHEQLPDGFSRHFTCSGDAWDSTVTHTSAMGRQTTYAMSSPDSGEEMRTNTFADGTCASATKAPDETEKTTLTDGTTIAVTLGADPRFGMMKPIETKRVVTLPSGLTSITTRTSTATLSNQSDPLSVVTLTDTTTINGRTSTAVYDAATRTWMYTTPAGRVSTTTLDAQGRIIRSEPPSVLPIDFVYDANGRTCQIAQGTRTQTFVHDPQTGYLSSVTDALSQETLFERDPVGRTTWQTMPDGKWVRFAYDSNGNTTWLKPPGKPAHGMQYTSANLISSYDPPVVSGSGTTSTTYRYNLDRQLDSILRPDGLSVGRTYDAVTGRLAMLVLPGGTATYGYDPGTGKLTSITGPYSVSLAYAYDGYIKTDETWTGEVAGMVHWVYDNDFRVVNETVNGAHAVAYAFDDDGIITAAGALTRTPEPATGHLSSTVLSNVAESLTYDAYGDLETYNASYAGTSLLGVGYTRDALGRIATKTETTNGETHTYTYHYDLRGRLHQVERDSTVVESYDYDDNGNRLNGTYDDQDRLLAYGTKTYTYTANGELASVYDSTADETTTYQYDVQGALLRVDKPDGTLIEYVIDGTGRRVGKKVNGALQWGLLYRSALQPVALLDGAGNVVDRYVYGSSSNVPEYVERGGATYRIITDHLGSVRLVVNVSTGEVVQRMEYDSFGRVLVDEVAPGWAPVSFGFAGGVYDRDTGLVRFGARDFDAEVGRWSSKDPMMTGTNWYPYIDSDPVSLADPSGLCTVRHDKYQECMERMEEKRDNCHKNVCCGPKAYKKCDKACEDIAVKQAEQCQKKYLCCTFDKSGNRTCPRRNPPKKP